MFAEHLLEFTKDFELSQPDQPDGGYSLLLDNSAIRIERAGNGFQLVSIVSDLPSEGVELFFAKMLRGNLFSQATYGSVLGLDENGTQIILRYYYPHPCNYRNFKEKIEDFINAIDFWKAEVGVHQANPKGL